MYMFKLLFIYGVVLCVKNVFGQTEVGDKCVDQDSGKPGICTRYSSCPSAIHKFEFYGSFATNCGEEYDIVCCQQDPPRTTTPSWRKPPTQRISERKCEQYSKPVTKVEQFTLNTANGRTMELTVANCEYKKKNTLISNGVPAIPGEFPHMAALGWPSIRGYLFKCGGTLISERFVLTAAHCSSLSSRDTDTTSNTPTVVRLGDHDLRDGVEDMAQPVTIDIQSILKHPRYNGSVYDDIALIQLNKDVEFNSFVRPACLWQTEDFDGMDTSTVIGWGDTKFRGTQSNVLLKVQVNIFSNERCEPLLRGLQFRRWRGFQREQMCAGDLSGKNDTCQGDSGGPLTLTKPRNDCIFYLAGITSFGYPCGRQNGPGIYVRVALYLQWIESVVWPN